MRKKWLFLIAVLIGSLLLSACSSNTVTGDGAKIMRVATVVTDDRSLSKGLYEFERIVEEESEGSIEVEVFTNGVLGGDRQIFEGLQLNTIQGATMSTGPISQFAESFNVFDLPFLFPNKEIAYQVLDGPIGQEILNTLPEENVIGLNYWENGYRLLTNNIREIDEVEDVQGLDIRVLENDMHMRIWNELGANPTPMSYGELYIGLEQGTVDGQENPVGNIVNDQFYEVQDYLTKTNHVYNASPFLVSKPFWDSLTEEEKQIVKDAADKAQELQREQNQLESETGFEILKEHGMTITELSEEQQQSFREAVEPVYEHFKQQYGSELVDKIESQVEKFQKN